MKRVMIVELPQTLRKRVAIRLTENPESDALGVLAFEASVGKELREVVGALAIQRARRELGRERENGW